MEEKAVGIRQYLSFLIPLLLAMAIIVSFSVVIARRHTEWKQVQAKKKALEREVAQLQEKNLGLHKLRDSLLYDPVQIEKEAREQLGYSRPEEVIYKGSNLEASDAAKKEDLSDPSTAEGRFKRIGLLSFFA
ncbi:MAG: septum formation initiator family protein, partial [Candidatus Brocadiales bacterium]